mmetsp:Transcript_18290/g.30725  ORF Transcript_18290/g.30725 Transcript_18290/m.30725 type:complete len:154 (-) Transcript_18290:486-947(-)
MHGIAYSWDRDVASHVLPLGSARPSPPYDMGMQCLWYSYAVHHEGTGVLTTELPHVVKFLVTRMILIATKHVSGLTTLFGDVCSRDDIRILTQEEFIALLAPLFFKPHRKVSRYWWRKRQLRKDAVLRMRSTARQQAVTISLNLPVVDSVDTN